MKLAPNLKLPPEAVTETFAILGIRGSGKTTTATVFAEELLAAGNQVVIVDPVDVWWGLRSSKDGKTAGYPITILGGDRADLPLEPTGGAVLADFVVEHGLSCILSTRHLSMNDQRRLITDFAERLYDKKGRAENRTPLQLIIDEADAFVPQRIQRGQERMFGSIDRLVRRGRSSGLGVTLISQRPAVVNKDVLTQCEVLICHRTISPHDRKALDAWVEAHDAENQREVFMGSLAALERGEAWFWSPSWLQVFDRVKLRDRRTFDSSATPKAGQVRAKPKKTAEVDLGQLREQMAATLERAKADDPRELRREIADLRAKLQKNTAAAPDPRSLVDEYRKGYEAGVRDEAKRWLPIAKLMEQAHGVIIENAKNGALMEERPSTAKLAPVVPIQTPPVKKAAPPSSNGTLDKAQRALLHAIAERDPKPCSRAQIAILSGYSIKSSSFANALGALRSGGYVVGSGDDNRLTDAGRAITGDVSPRSAAERLEQWRAKLEKADRALLDVIVAAYPNAVAREVLAERSGYSITSSSFANALGKLRTLELVSGRQEVTASPELV